MIAIQDSENIKRRGVVLAAITKLKRILDYPSLITKDEDISIDRSQKLRRLIDMIYEIRSSNEKALIFTQYRDAGKILKEVIQNEMNEEVLFLSGESSRKLRDTMINRFQKDSGPAIFIISLKAGVEEKIDELIESKSMIMDQVVASGEGWITSLSNDKLKEILTLRKDSIESVEMQ